MFQNIQLHDAFDKQLYLKVASGAINESIK